MEIIPIHLEKESSRFDIYDKITKNTQDITIENYDILVISSKYLSISEGRIKKLDYIIPSQNAIQMAK
ncbi:MAG TPA: coenzyme F420-0:L-glutamate ligase, partial [Candidatus Nitrosocosmicus sp.]|nr:coenzyme F420-0:L-glutamate ligase [Candidatus Nitrosocosmicus sp.]